ncbi:MAG TPA: FUSC family membrane protein [Burkholderiaceae bacterium]|nr:FUSC family membrane protein [Burkholderiaceae bacterium]
MSEPLANWWSRALRVGLSYYVANGLSAAFGLGLISAAMHLGAGAFAAAAALVGVIVVIPPDQPAPRRGKFRQLLPAALIGPPLFLAMQLLHGDVLRTSALLVPAAFVAFLAAAWGRRGLPISMSIMFAMLFSIATPTPPDRATAISTSLYFTLGAFAYVVYATLANLVLNARYRVTMLADTLLAVASLMRTQAARFAPQAGDASAASMPVLGLLLRQQAALADQLQAARDIVLESPRTPRRQQLASMLLAVLELRDHLVACELDLETLREPPEHVPVLDTLRRELETLALQLETLTDALLTGRTPAAFSTGTQALRERVVAALTLAADSATAPPSTEPLARSLIARVGHIADEVRRLTELARGDAKPDLAAVRAAWQLFTSPTAWSWRPLDSLWRWDAPPLRHAIRAALAIGAGQVLSIALPWGTHDYWILLTITVVLRGSFAQTLERRNIRVAGTLVGCVLAGALLSLRAPLPVLLVVVTLAQGIAHAFAVRRYLITVIAATLLALLQARLLNSGVSPVFEVAERIADTLVGVAIAWAFSYVLPSWERTQIPALVRRTLRAQASHAKVALGLGQLDAVDNESEVDWRLARREVYDSLSALVQATQRSLSEPRAVRPPLPALERLMAHSYQLLAQLTAVKTMLLLRRGRLNADQTRAPLRDAAEAIAARLANDDDHGNGPTAASVESRAVDDDDIGGELAPGPVALPDPFEHDLSPWLLRRLHLAADIAAQLNAAARRVLDGDRSANRPS